MKVFALQMLHLFLMEILIHGYVLHDVKKFCYCYQNFISMEFLENTHLFILRTKPETRYFV